MVASSRVCTSDTVRLASTSRSALIGRKLQGSSLYAEHTTLAVGFASNKVRPEPAQVKPFGLENTRDYTELRDPRRRAPKSLPDLLSNERMPPPL